MSPKTQRKSLPRIPALVLLLTLMGALPVNAQVTGSSGVLSGALACGSAFEQGLAGGYRCFMDQLVNGVLLDKTAQYANTYGKRLFGEHFSLANRFTYSQTGGGFNGEVDAVVPLSALAGFAGFGGPDGEDVAGSLFFQQGVTNWTDRQGLRRYDVRYGLVRRFNVSDDPGANVFGLSSFFQQNLEYGHSRVVSGFDYDGAWGRSTFNYFLPTTGWRNSLRQSGYEERALEGMELAFNLTPTSTVGLETALTRWEARDGTGRWDNGARVGLSWQPHAWLNVRTSWDGIGTRTPNPSASIQLSFPLGSREPTPDWQGLGLAGGSSQNSGGRDLWRPIQNIGQIRVAERERVMEHGLPHGLTVRFLQNSAGSGEAIRVAITLNAPAREDVRLSVRLIPGEGDNPAVPGEDYVDEPVEVTINQGTTKGIAKIRLLRNDTMTEARSLGVTVSRIGA